MASFGRGLFGGIKEGLKIGSSIADRKRKRKEFLDDLESEREYAEEIYDKRERDKRAEKDREITELLLTKKDSFPEAKKRLLGEATEKRGIGPSPEGVEQTDFPKLIHPTGGRILREEGDVVGALRDMSLAKKTALFKHLELKSALYDDRVKEAVSGAKVYGGLSAVNPKSAGLEMKKLTESFRDDPKVLSRINSAFDAGAALEKTGIGRSALIDEGRHDSDFARQQPYIESLLFEINGAQEEGVLQKQAREIFDGGGVKSLENQWAEIKKVEGLIDILDNEEIDHDFTRNSPFSVVEPFVQERLEPEAKTAAEKSLKVLQDAQKRFTSIDDPEEKAKAKEELKILSALIGDYNLGLNEDGSFDIYKPSGGKQFSFHQVSLSSGGTSTIFVPNNNTPEAIAAAEAAAKAVRDNKDLTVSVENFNQLGGSNDDDNKEEVLDLDAVGEEKGKEGRAKMAERFLRGLPREDKKLFLRIKEKLDKGVSLNREEEDLFSRFNGFIKRDGLPPLPTGRGGRLPKAPMLDLEN